MELVNAYLTIIDAIDTPIAMMVVMNTVAQVSQHHVVQVSKLCTALQDYMVYSMHASIIPNIILCHIQPGCFRLVFQLTI